MTCSVTQTSMRLEYGDKHSAVCARPSSCNHYYHHLRVLSFFLSWGSLLMQARAWQCIPASLLHVTRPTATAYPPNSSTSATMTALFASSEPTDDDNNDKDHQIQKHLQARHDALQIEKTRQQLEVANTQSFLKRKPRKLPYEDARRWVQANLGCDTAEEYDDLVANGNLRTPYIPKRPEEYYTETREWISWEHFLKGCFDDENPSAVKPRTGVFD